MSCTHCATGKLHYVCYHPKEPKMSDFKVGDVVRFKNATVPGKVASIRSPSQVDVHVAGITYYGMDPGDFTLVSRPSEAKSAFTPLPVGTKVRVAGNPAGEGVIAEGGYRSQYNHNEYIYMVRMPGYSYPISYPECAVFEIKSAPALKVGDRVRVKPGHAMWSGVTGTITILRPHPMAHRIRNDAQYAHIPDAGGEMGECQFCEDSLELLPPEPAKVTSEMVKGLQFPLDVKVGRVLDNEFEWLANKRPYEYPKPPKPMTTTRASPQEKYLAAKLIAKTTENLYRKALGSIYDEVAKPYPVATSEHFVKYQRMAEIPSPNGWMPAGTYMPIKFDDVVPFKYAKPQLKPQTARNGLFLEKCPKDGNTSTLATKNISKPHFPERTRLTTRSWDPGYGDLEDAE